LEKSSRARLDAVFAALADETRRQIVVRLAAGPASVGELAEPFAMSLPAVIKHIRVLERAGILRGKRSGRVHHYFLDGRALQPGLEFMTHYRSFWEDTLDELVDYLQSGADLETE
jgi:DNA-binding transcriptional ArsR family regulator